MEENELIVKLKFYVKYDSKFHPKNNGFTEGKTYEILSINYTNKEYLTIDDNNLERNIKHYYFNRINNFNIINNFNNIDSQRKEIFSIYHYAKTHNIKLSETEGFTENKKYEILEEKYYSTKNNNHYSAINDYSEYLIIDDNGNKRYVSHIYFLPSYSVPINEFKMGQMLTSKTINPNLDKIINELEDKVIECHNLIAKLRNQTKNAN